jgi:hypothetical protein
MTEVIAINQTGGTDGRGYALLRNLPDGQPFPVIAAALRQITAQTHRGDTDRQVLAEALKELDGLNEGSEATNG